MSKLTEAQQTISAMESKIAELVAASQAALELVGIVTAERDALAAQVRIMYSALEKAKPHVRTCYKQGYAEWSDFESVTGALEFLPQHHLAAHDAEVAKKAV